MAHELEMLKNGKASMFWVGQTPWHGLGTGLDNPPTVEDGLTAAGLDWEVGLKSLVTETGDKVDHKATYRKSDGQIFGVVGPGYTPLQNKDAFGWFQPLLDAGEVELHTAGALQGGRKVWVLGKVTRPALEIADGDSVERFVLLSNSHDGTRSVRVGFTPIRVVCANTLRLARSAEREGNKLVKVLHTKGVRQALEDLREIMQLANASFEATAEQYRKLARHKIGRWELRKYVKVVLQVEDGPEDDLPKQTRAKIDGIVYAALAGRGNDNPAVHGTLWAAYNGVTEYLSYTYGRSQDARLDSLWWGDNANLSQRALDVALGMAV